MDVSAIVVLVVVTALVFDFTNGFHDTANAMAASIATGALRPRVAVGIAAALNLAGAFLSVQVARTVSGGLVDDTLITPVVVVAACGAAVAAGIYAASRRHPVGPGPVTHLPSPRDRIAA